MTYRKNSIRKRSRRIGAKAIPLLASVALVATMFPAFALGETDMMQLPLEETQEKQDSTTAEDTGTAENEEGAQDEAGELEEIEEAEENAVSMGNPPAEQMGEKAGGQATGLAEGPTESSVVSPASVANGELKDGVNIIAEGASGVTFDITDGKAVMISNQQSNEPIVFENCTFNLAGGTVKISGNQEGISYNNGETVTKLFVSGNVQFNSCTFVTEEGATKTTSAGYDAAIYFFSGNINLTGCTLSAEGYNGQFLGLYGSAGAVTFDDCDISTVGNKNGWSYAMYGGSVLKLTNGSSMTATGSTTDSGNINAFYSGDNRTGYDAIYVDDSTIDFSDNHAGGFAINNVNIHVSNGSTITVNDNLGNACNSGYWIVDDSTIQMNGNKGGHALSCIGFEMTGSTLDIEHNGYAGVYLQSRDSLLTNCTVDIACNGEKLLSYSAGDVWLQDHALTVTDCTSTTLPGSAWLGAVGRQGAVTTPSGSIVAHDLNTHTVDNLKSSCSEVLANATIADTDSHTLFLNPFMESDYARGNAESSASDNDADLFADDNVTDRTDIIGAKNAKIGTLTDADLAHHKYDWANGEVTDQATESTYGVIRYTCTLACDDYTGRTEEHANSFDCAGTYVYAPLVGLTFDANVPTVDGVALEVSSASMPDDQTAIDYNGTVSEPGTTPVMLDDSDEYNWVFTGWYADPECTTPYDFSTELTDNWTVVYAGWEQVPADSEEEVIPPTGTDDPDGTATTVSDTLESTPTTANASATQTGDATVLPLALCGTAIALLTAFAIALVRRYINRYAPRR